MSDDQNSGDDNVEYVDEYADGEEQAKPKPLTALTFVIPAVIIVILFGLWLWNEVRKSAGLNYRPHVEPLPGGSESKDNSKYVTRERIAMRKGITWGPVPPEDVKRAGYSLVELEGILTPAANNVSIDMHSLKAYADSVMINANGLTNAMFVAGSNTDTVTVKDGDDTTTAPEGSQPMTQEEIDEYIRSRMPLSPQDMAGIRCKNKRDWLFFQTTRLPNADQTLIDPSWGNGYCLMTCDAARISTDPSGQPSKVSQKFSNAKGADGKFLVHYELALWIDPRHNEAGYTWYCRPVPNVNTDGVGWSPTVDGMYQRRLISPVYYKTSRDPFRGTYGDGDNANDDWKLCSNSTLPVPHSSELGGWTYKASSVRWHGQVYKGKSDNPWSIGYDKTNYTLVDFQMIGRYCYWVGHDDYNEGGYNESKADANFHGNFSKIKLANACPKQQVGQDGQKYDMQLVPSHLSCYYCPRVYEWNTAKNQLEAYETFLRGSEVDGYVCVRQCPTGMSDEQSGNLHWCIPIGISMDAEMPTYVEPKK